MYLQKLSIISESDENNKTIREIKFKKGVNFVTDSLMSNKHNQVGKTTFLRLIDVGLGAKNKSDIYVDSDTRINNDTLKKLIEQSRICIELEIGNKIGGDVAYKLKVELFERGKYFVNGKQCKQSKYRKKLNEIFFKNKENVPTFRSLISMFVRISLNDDNNKFLKTLNPSTTTGMYRTVYNYLFNIGDPATDKKIDDLKKKANEIGIALRQFKDVNQMLPDTHSSDELINLEKEAENIREQLKDILSKSEFEKNREAINRIRKEYTVLTNRINEIDFKISQNNYAIESQRNLLKNTADINVVKEFYDEIATLMSENLEKRFSDLLKFNNQLKDNKISFYKSINKKLNNEKLKVLKNRQELENKNSNLISIISDNNIDDYTNLNYRLSEIENKINSENENIRISQRLTHERESINNKIQELQAKHKNEDYKVNMQIFNKYFIDYAYRINQEKPILEYEKTGFPLKIKNMNDGPSTGTKKSLIAAYNFAYQQFAKEIEKIVPNFVIQDVIETIEGNDLRKIVDIANETNTQYIIAVLHEKLKSSDFSKSELHDHIVLELNSQDRLFGN